MIKSLTIPRINVASPFASPVQWSENCQVAVNARTGLVVLEPKLPRVTQEIFGTKGTLLLKGLFRVSQELDFERLKEAVDEYRRNEAAVSMDVDSGVGDKQLSQKFAFVEPLLAEHKWSPVDPITRRCSLAILYNTYDLIVLRDDMSVRRMIANVKTFAFVNYNMLSYISETGNLVFTSLSNSEEEDITYELSGTDEFGSGVSGDTIKLAWNKDTSSLALTTSLNSVWLVRFDFNELTSGPQRIVEESRFGVSCVKWITFEETEYLIVAQTGKLTVSSVTSMEEEYSVTTTLENYEMVVGVYFSSLEGSTIVNVAFDNGLVQCFEFKKETRELVTSDGEKGNSLVKLVRKSLYKHQLLSQLDTNTSGRDDTVEGQFFNVATDVVFDGLLTVAYKILPKDVINYTITSKDYMELALVRIGPLRTDVPGTTAISYLMRLWIDNCARFPSFPHEASELESFVKEINLIKLDIIEANLENTVKDITNPPDENSELNKLQRQFNFNYSLILSVQKWLREPIIAEQITKWTSENTEVVGAIRKWLQHYILAMTDGSEITDEFDQFIVQSVSPTQDHPITISVANQFFTESFTATNSSVDTLTLSSDHVWPRCQLTLLPIMEMESTTDELGVFHYGVYDGITIRSTVVRELLGHIQYCVFSGNRLQPLGK